MEYISIPARSKLEVAKFNKRLVIRDIISKNTVYVMPSFLLPVKNRGVLVELANRLEAGEGIAAIMQFETAHNRRAKKNGDAHG